MRIPAPLKHDTLVNAVDVLSRAFMRDSFQRYFNRTHLGLQRGSPITYEQNRQIFSMLLPQLKATGALLLTTPETPFVTTVWQLEKIPREAVPKKPPSGVPEAIHELFGSSMDILQDVLPVGTPILHYILAGNLKSKAGRHSKQKGLSIINKEMFAAAAEANLPVVAEATCINSRDMCLHLGFQQLKEMRLGHGTTNKIGEAEEGGCGLPIYLLMRKP